MPAYYTSFRQHRHADDELEEDTKLQQKMHGMDHKGNIVGVLQMD